ncbi:Vegetative incompatibility protein [Paramyrothecium foliicola]|nr:Vegetative incompatibility protein [Paramyrothecium foliicola]
MRLIDTSTLEVVDFSHEWYPPPYAILSHRWGRDEVTLRDMQTSPREEGLMEREGYRKIENFCQVARQRGFRYGWIDTCCIDKTNSAELSEAINSMFEWYTRSVVCYAYLADAAVKSEILGSEWFARGWTLQELIAPKRLIFFSCDWVPLATKANLGKEIEERHGVPDGAFSVHDNEMWSTAQIFSWAAKRTTSRVEDEAYSLLGLFRVNMPLIYGEGSKAFVRLQQEIIKKSADQSIFAWHDSSIFGPFAWHHHNFRNCGNIVADESSEFQLTNRGLRIELPLIPVGEGFYDAFLACHDKTTNERVAITLRKTPSGRFERFSFSNGFPSYRFSPESIEIPKPQPIYIAEPPRGHPNKQHYQEHYWGIDGIHYIRVDYSSLLDTGFELEDHTVWNSRRGVLDVLDEWQFTDDGNGEIHVLQLGVYAGLLFFHPQNSVRLVVATGAENDRHWIHIEEMVGEDEGLETVVRSYYCAEGLYADCPKSLFDQVNPGRSKEVTTGKDLAVVALSSGSTVSASLEPGEFDGEIKMLAKLNIEASASD